MNYQIKQMTGFEKKYSYDQRQQNYQTNNQKDKDDTKSQRRIIRVLNHSISLFKVILKFIDIS